MTLNDILTYANTYVTGLESATLNDIFGGDGPEQTKLKQKMEKVLYKDIKKKYANSAEIIGLL